MIISKSRSYKENINKAIENFRNTHGKDPDFLLMEAQLYHNYLASLPDEEKSHPLIRNHRYGNSLIIITNQLEQLEIIPVSK